ncbi:hypothetical protein ACTI_32970 [Actinoplanes sp. OR16]|uniref:hypothetical protein n=1 Tax=Actinoplanes sp. OR16 TaxID=946334 RepID=UPI000F70B5D2|nr:hypothetical protein [Actinoplanes sp. OR16]BBH66612.1 hypothetical protein ACTI_32970 [Actinoplanes sp. OR16]
MSTAPYVPLPPAGPGVHPPFPAPPVEGRGRRIGMGLGIAGGILALVCGGGAVAIAGLATAMDNAINEQVDVVVSRYMEAVQDREFTKAYGLLCQDARSQESREDYITRMTASEQVAAYYVGDVDLTYGTVPVDVTYADGDTAVVQAELAQNTSTGAFEVCGLGE